MKYLLPCECGEKVSIEVGQAGQTIECPQCDRPLEVPTMREIRALETVRKDVADSPVARKWSQSQGIMFAAGVGCMVIAVIVAGLLYYVTTGLRRTQPEVDLTKINEAIDNSSAESLYQTWQDEIESQELPDWQRPTWVYEHEAANSLMILVYAALAIAVCGAAVAIGSLFLRSRRRHPAPRRPAGKAKSEKPGA